MTREEALKEFVGYQTYDIQPSVEATKMAIEALEQEPCEDAISRKTAIDAMIKLEQDDIDQYGCKIPEGFDSSPAIEALNNLPSITSQPKVGHWIGQKYIGYGKRKDYIVQLKDGFVTGSCSCSECGEWLTGSDEYQCYGNYCPNCGCRMESEDKE